MHSFFICLLYHCHEPDSLRIVLWSYAITRHCMTVQTAQSDTFIVKIYDKFMSVWGHLMAMVDKVTCLGCAIVRCWVIRLYVILYGILHAIWLALYRTISLHIWTIYSCLQWDCNAGMPDISNMYMYIKNTQWPL